MPDSFLRKKKSKNRFLAISLITIVIITSIYIYNYFYIDLARAERNVDFKIYQAQYKQSEEKILVWLDQNGTIPCTEVTITVHPDFEWVYNKVNPEQFIKLEFSKYLHISNDIPFFQEIFIEYLYFDENVEKKGDKILWMVIDRNDIL